MTRAALEKEEGNLEVEGEKIMEIGNGVTRDGFCGADYHRFTNAKNENLEGSLSDEFIDGNLRINADPKRLSAISKNTAHSTVAPSPARSHEHGSAASSTSPTTTNCSNEPEPSSISALELARLLRARASSSPISVLDCRPVSAFTQGHCIEAEHISPLPTLYFNRLKGKPDFWSGVRQKLSIPDYKAKGHASTVVLIDDDQNDIAVGNFCGANGRTESGQRSKTPHQPFSSFLLSNLRNEGCRTHFLEKGEMTHFLADYPDLCVFEQRCESGSDDEERKNGQLTPLHFEGGTTPRPCNSEFVNGVSAASASLLSKRRSTTAAPILLPFLKLRDLTLGQDSPTCSSSITNHSAVSEDELPDASMKNVRPSLSSTMTSELDYEKCSSNCSRAASTQETFDKDNEGKLSNDRDPVNIYATLYLGNAENAIDLETLRRYNIKYILNVTSDLPNKFENVNCPGVDGGFKYLRIPIVDNVSQNLVGYFPMANEFIDEAIERKCGVLVHCLAGISRSVTITVAYLMKSKPCTMDEAYDFVKKRKPNVEPNLNFMRQLLDYERTLLRSDGGGNVTPDSAVSSLSTSSSSSVCVEPVVVRGEEKEQGSISEMAA